MSPEHILHIRTQILLALEDICSVNIRLREFEDNLALGNEADEIADWLDNATENLTNLTAFIRTNKA